ncbi:early nodulin-like protein 1 [Zingiber officinale]|uniref:Phytocyanin domain-containing protein n=1 Tax=Zingiber officinale TaxID=94328 RepID=A0A8J5G4G8_ZINOF|nr:early nodulin-like protein 1 [Zingiber officinale]KAG6499471.1 hypothetical protein ZIOFF_039259 [Zingiber officinale]
MFRAAPGVILASALLLLLQVPNGCLCYQYKVGDLNCWGLPPSSNRLLYHYWSRNHSFRVGDSLLFLYPPSQDSVVQVTARAFNTCVVATPLLRLNDGNSLFNLTSPGYYFFTSGVAGHCAKNQKLAVAVPSADGTFPPPPADEGVVADAPPPGAYQSFPIVFGPTPTPGSSVSAALSPMSAGSGVVAAAASAFFLLGVAFV